MNIQKLHHICNSPVSKKPYKTKIASIENHRQNMSYIYLISIVWRSRVCNLRKNWVYNSFWYCLAVWRAGTFYVVPFQTYWGETYLAYRSFLFSAIPFRPSRVSCGLVYLLLPFAGGVSRNRSAETRGLRSVLSRQHGEHNYFNNIVTQFNRPLNERIITIQ